MSVQLPCLLADGMVLQRNAPVSLWGTADEPVDVEFLGQAYHALPDVDGQWRVTLPALSAGGPFTLRVNQKVLRDVYVGDVWLCSGQSNMQLTMERVRHRYPEEWQDTTPMIRQFTVPQRADFSGSNTALEGGCWQAASLETLNDFSAVGYFFAHRIFREYGVPIGLLQCAIGGTPIHAWMSRNALADFPDLLKMADLCADDGYVKRVQAEDAENDVRFLGEIDENDPGLKERWFDAGFDDNSWEKRPLLSPWEGTGSVWLRKTLYIPRDLEGEPATLFLGTVADGDTVYVNGELVGTTAYRYPPREYHIPALPGGRCVIAIRVISKKGGGFTPGKQYLLSTPRGCMNLNSLWRFHRGGEAGEPLPETYFHNMPAGLYHGMLAPLQAYRICGALWYQGESDAANPARYAEKCINMVRDWRDGWGYDFPFLSVELAWWGEGTDWVRLREEQWRALECTPGAAMAAAYDAGEDNDLHPQNKRVIGERLARCALRLYYGEKLPPSPFELIPFRK